MKTKNFLSRFSAAALLAAALIPAALTSCSSDSEPTPAPDPIPEGMAQINLSFATPAMGVETRAGNISDNDQNIEADTDEANIKSLWLYIFKQDAENTSNYTLSYAFDCTNRIAATNVLTYQQVALGAASGSGYVEGLAVTPGTYRFFMVANLESYLSTTDASKYTPAVSGVVTDALKNVTISDIQNIALSMYENNSIKLKTTDLPMGMNYDEVQLQSAGSATLSNGNVTITSGSTSIVCDMTFLCSAVRYTFIYDKSDFSWNYSKFDFTSLKLNNIVDGYKFTEKKELTAAANDQNVDLIDGKKCSIEDIDVFINKPFNLTASDSQTWATDAKHAYQGIVYLPSNYTLTEGNKTTMKLTCDLGETDNKVYDIVLPNTNTTNADANRLSKGNFYDVIGKVSASGMEFFVTVRQWKKGDRQVIDF